MIALAKCWRCWECITVRDYQRNKAGSELEPKSKRKGEEEHGRNHQRDKRSNSQPILMHRRQNLQRNAIEFFKCKASQIINLNQLLKSLANPIHREYACHHGVTARAKATAQNSRMWCRERRQNWEMLVGPKGLVSIMKPKNSWGSFSKMMGFP